MNKKVKWAVPHPEHRQVLISLLWPLSSWVNGPLSQCDDRPTVTFPAAECHRPLASTKLYCLVTEAHGCEQLAHAPRSFVTYGAIQMCFD